MPTKVVPSILSMGQCPLIVHIPLALTIVASIINAQFLLLIVRIQQIHNFSLYL